MSDAVLTSMVFQLRDEVSRLRAEVAELKATKTATVIVRVPDSDWFQEGAEGRSIPWDSRVGDSRNARRIGQ